VTSTIVEILLNFNGEICFSYFICVIHFVPHLRCSLFPVSVWRPIFCLLVVTTGRRPELGRVWVSALAISCCFSAIPFGSIYARCLPARVLFPYHCLPEELVRLSESVFCSCLFVAACNLYHCSSHQVSASNFFLEPATSQICCHCWSLPCSDLTYFLLVLRFLWSVRDSGWSFVWCKNS
jgi:hypothetical protein